MFAGRLGIRSISRLALALFFMVAGVNHFVNPQFYLPLIPDYLPFHEAINWLSGWIEVVLGAGLLWSTTRRMSSIGIILLMVAFIPSHVYFIQIGACVEDGLCTPMWLAWARLVLVHPLLMWWAWVSGKKEPTG